MTITELAQELGLDETGARNLMRTFVSATSEDVERLEEAASAARPEAAAEIAHHIKGAAANLELESVRVAAHAAETEARSGGVAGIPARAAEIRAELARISAEL